MIFFKKQDPDCYSKCPDETYASGEPGCVQACTEDCPGNGLMASLLAAAISVPVSGSLNFLFAWLRKPLEHDLAIKELELPALESELRSCSDENLHADKNARNKCALVGRWVQHQCMMFWQDKLQCCRATFPVVFRWLEGTTAVKPARKRAAASQRLSASYIAPKRAEVGQRKRDLEAAMEELWSEFDPDKSGSIDTKHLQMLMEQLNRPRAVSEVAVKFVMRTADVSKTGVLGKDELRVAIPTYLALQSEQKRIAAMFDRFDVDRNGFLDPKEVADMLQELNDHVPATPGEVAWIMANADVNANGKLDKSETLRAVALWYPRLHKRRATNPPPLAAQADARRIQSRLALGECTVALEPLLKHASASSGILHRKDVASTLKAFSAPCDAETVNWVLDLADCASPECILRDEIQPALAIHLALIKSGAADCIRNGFLQEFGSDTIFADHIVSKANVEALLTRLSGSSVPTKNEVAWVFAMADEHQSSDSHSHRSDASKVRECRRHDVHRAVALWYIHVHALTPMSHAIPRAGSTGTGNTGIRRRAAAVQLPVHRAWVSAAFRAEGAHDGSVDVAVLDQLMATINGGKAVEPSEIQFVALLSDQNMDGRMHRADLEAALAMWRGLQTELSRIDAILDSQQISRKLGRKKILNVLTEINEGHPPTQRELDWVVHAAKQNHLLPRYSTGPAASDAPTLDLVERLQGGRKKPSTSLEIPPAPTLFQTQVRFRINSSYQVPCVQTLIGCTRHLDRRTRLSRDCVRTRAYFPHLRAFLGPCACANFAAIC